MLCLLSLSQEKHIWRCQSHSKIHCYSKCWYSPLSFHNRVSIVRWHLILPVYLQLSKHHLRQLEGLHRPLLNIFIKPDFIMIDGVICCFNFSSKLFRVWRSRLCKSKMWLNQQFSPQFQCLHCVYICKKKEGELVPCTPLFRRLCISILTRKRGYHLTRNIQFVLCIFINKSPWLYQ